MAKIDDIKQTSEEVAPPPDEDIDLDEPRPVKHATDIDPDKPAGTTDPRP